MILLIRSNDIVSDTRANKYIRYFKEKNIKYTLLGWNRNPNTVALPDQNMLNLKSSFGNGGLKAIYHRIIWMFFVLKFLLKNGKKFKTIHACDLDACFPTCVYKYFSNNKIIIIFDVFDWFSATLGNNGIITKFAFYIMEYFSIKLSDEIIICEPERINQIPFKLKKKELVLPNIPYFDNYNFLNSSSNYLFDNNNITIAYVGGFYQGRLLKELISISKEGFFNLHIAGYGSDEIQTLCNEANKLSNVKYYGQVDYEEGLRIMNNSDLIYAMYSKENKNHLYAAPNKLYEAMLLGKPIVSTKGISLEKKLIEYDIGYTIDESYICIRDFILNVDREELKIKGHKANNIWNIYYRNYTSLFFNNIYYNIIN